MVETRSRIGDCELDTMRASTAQSVIVTMTERRSLLHLLAFSPDGTTSNERDAIVHRLRASTCHCPGWVCALGRQKRRSNALNCSPVHKSECQRFTRPSALPRLGALGNARTLP